MPTPPKLGVGWACQRSSEGWATTRPAAGDRRSVQITAAVTGAATIATAVLTRSQGNRMPLARCEDATAAPGRTLQGSGGRGPAPRGPGAARPGRPYTGPDGRLRRPRPLPGAVREPLPARLPGQVPRLGARRALVAAQPGGADGRLPALLRR